MQDFFAHGKLLITGEYFVLSGAKALAVPTKQGQQLSVQSNDGKNLAWKSLNDQGETWFNAEFNPSDLAVINSSDTELANKLQNILKYIHKASPQSFDQSLSFTSKLEFNRAWGWGSSSTLISLLSQWSKIPAQDILKNTIGGSGYDVACAVADGPIFYQLQEEQPEITRAPFPKLFLNNLFLVYLGKKQESGKEIKKYEDLEAAHESLLRQVSQLTNMAARSADLGTFCACLQELERYTGDFLERTPIQETIFKNLPGAAKSLGAWGGDFVLLATPWPFAKVKQFCNDLGLTTVFNFETIVKL